MQRVIVISGASGGIGRATAEQFAAHGDTVYDLSRSGSSAGRIRHIDCDLNDAAQIVRAFDQIGAEAGRIDALINNAGFGISGAVEYTDPADIRRLFNIDLFAAAGCVQAALPWLRKSETARIINISSVAAVFAIPFQSYYSAVKAALLLWSEGLAHELAPTGVQVTAMLPGDVKTGFTQARHKNPAGHERYGERIARALQVMEHDEQNGMPPEKIAAAIYRLTGKRKLKPRYTVGVKYHCFLFLGRVLPASLAHRIVGAMYDKP